MENQPWYYSDNADEISLVALYNRRILSVQDVKHKLYQERCMTTAIRLHPGQPYLQAWRRDKFLWRKICTSGCAGDKIEAWRIADRAFPWPKPKGLTNEQVAAHARERATQEARGSEAQSVSSSDRPSAATQRAYREVRLSLAQLAPVSAGPSTPMPGSSAVSGTPLTEVVGGTFRHASISTGPAQQTQSDDGRQAGSDVGSSEASPTHAPPVTNPGTRQAVLEETAQVKLEPTDEEAIDAQILRELAEWLTKDMS